MSTKVRSCGLGLKIFQYQLKHGYCFMHSKNSLLESIFRDIKCYRWNRMKRWKPYENEKLMKTWNGLYKLLFKHSNNTIDFLILIKWNFSLLSHQRINWYYEKIWAVELKLIIHFIGLYIKKRELGKNELEWLLKKKKKKLLHLI